MSAKMWTIAAVALFACLAAHAAPKPALCEATVTPASHTMAPRGGNAVFDVESEVAWRIESDAGWATVHPATGAGNGAFEVICGENRGAARETTITVTPECTGATPLEVTVSQGAGGEAPWRLSVAESPALGGMVTATPAGDANYEYDDLVLVNLTATPNPGYTFDRWEGVDTSTGASASLTMNADRDVVARFKFLRSLLLGAFANADANDDDALSFAEAATSAPNLTQPQFDLLDCDGNAAISHEELLAPCAAAACGCLPAAKALTLANLLGDLFVFASALLTIVACGFPRRV